MSIPELAVTFFTNIFIIWFVQMMFQLMSSVKFSSFEMFDGAAEYTKKQFSFPIF